MPLQRGREEQASVVEVVTPHADRERAGGGASEGDAAEQPHLPRAEPEREQKGRQDDGDEAVGEGRRATLCCEPGALRELGLVVWRTSATLPVRGVHRVAASAVVPRSRLCTSSHRARREACLRPRNTNDKIVRRPALLHPGLECREPVVLRRQRDVGVVIQMQEKVGSTRRR